MLAPGHIALGLTCYFAASKAVGLQPTQELYAIAALGSLLPDIDHPKSQVGRMLPHISRPIAAIFGHRGFTHSLLAVALVLGALVTATFHPNYATSLTPAMIAALCLGYLSHLFGDFLTVRGIPLLWPYREGDYDSIHIPLIAFRTGGPIEIALTTMLASFLAYNYVY